MYEEVYCIFAINMLAVSLLISQRLRIGDYETIVQEHITYSLQEFIRLKEPMGANIYIDNEGVYLWKPHSNYLHVLRIEGNEEIVFEYKTKQSINRLSDYMSDYEELSLRILNGEVKLNFKEIATQYNNWYLRNNDYYELEQRYKQSEQIFADWDYLLDTNDLNDNSYYERNLDSVRKNKYIEKADVEYDHYSNGRLKSIGIEVFYLRKGFSKDLRFKVGLWKYYNKDESLDKVIGYNLRNQKVLKCRL